MPDKKENTSEIKHSKFSLIELLTIILLVGLIFTFVVPVNQANISRQRVNEALTTMKMIGEKADDFKNNPDNGYYPEIDQLNLGEQINSQFFTYSIVADDSTIIAETKPDFGKKGAFLVYSLNGKQYRIGKSESDAESKKVLNENWLP